MSEEIIDPQVKEVLEELNVAPEDTIKANDEVSKLIGIVWDNIDEIVALTPELKGSKVKKISIVVEDNEGEMTIDMYRRMTEH